MCRFHTVTFFFFPKPPQQVPLHTVSSCCLDQLFCQITTAEKSAQKPSAIPSLFLMQITKSVGMKLSLLGVGGCGGGYHTLWAITGLRLRLKYWNSLPLLWTCTLSPSYLISAKIPFGHFLKAYSTDLHASACSATSKCNARHYKIKQYNAMQDTIK